jgi:hypothetical protein
MFSRALGVSKTEKRAKDYEIAGSIPALVTNER